MADGMRSMPISSSAERAGRGSWAERARGALRRHRCVAVATATVLLLLGTTLSVVFRSPEYYERLVSYISSARYSVTPAEVVPAFNAHDELATLFPGRFDHCEAGNTSGDGWVGDAPLALYHDRGSWWEADFVHMYFGRAALEVRNVNWAEAPPDPWPRAFTYVAVVGHRSWSEELIAQMLLNPPIVLFATGDEWLQVNPRWGKQLNALQKSGVQFVRQYNDATHAYESVSEQVPPVWIGPLGFMSGLLQSLADLPFESLLLAEAAATLSSERPNAFAFIGEMKRDRQEMVRTFKEGLPGVRHGHLGVGEKHLMLSEYPKSKVVLNGRGNSNLNCFRIYETMSLGALPVVLGRNWEGAHDYYLGPQALSGGGRMVNLDSLPYVVSTTWSEALASTKALLDRPAELDAAQARMLRYWRYTLCTARAQVKAQLESHGLPARST